MSNPTPEQAKAWMRNHTCVPMGGLPRWFVERLTEAADIKKDNRKENDDGEVQGWR